MKNTKLVIFDMDGTLFRTETVDIKAINNALTVNGFSQKTDDEILGIIGYTLNEAIKIVIDVDEADTLEKLSRDIISFEQEYIESSGELYAGITGLLDSLKKSGFKLCICSNGGKDYIEGIVKKFSLDRYFDDIRYSRDGVSKSKAVEILKKEHAADKFVMVGDRTSDIEAAAINGGISIGVTYGFGKEEVLSADYVIDTPVEIEEVLGKIYSGYENS